jgi:DNA-binding transcriptional LysR family regulator
MPTARLDSLEVFAAVAQRRSFRGAAKATGLSASTMSHTIRQLEEALGTRLLNRSTRSVAVTDAGAALLRRIAPALTELHDALDQFPAATGVVAGTLRINAPPPAIELVIAPIVGPFLKEFPHVRLEVTAEQQLVDIVAAGFDAGVRWGEDLAQDMIAVPLGSPQRFVIVVAPELLAKTGPVTAPGDLLNRPCIRQRFSNGVTLPWEFERRGRTVRIDPPAVLTSNNIALQHQAALDGAGFGSTFDGYVADDLAKGRLVSVLDDWQAPFPGPFLYYPSRRQIPPPLQALLDFLRKRRRAKPEQTAKARLTSLAR